ncbi:MAG: glycosyltransferase [Syntrophomonadaceae bacterium]|nr:glycosyltransferase [Syntrophomonadaceae bacterium]
MTAKFDILQYLSQDVRILSNRCDLLRPDILMVYPARLSPGKRFDKVVAFAAAIKRSLGYSIKVVFCDFPSSDIHPEIYKGMLIKLGRALNLHDDDIIFTSDLGYPAGFPRTGVLDLFVLSNLFFCPSFSESFGLTVLEAASRGNFLVLNEKVPALQELGNQLNAYFMRWDARGFDADTREVYYPSEQDYLEEHVLRVIDLMWNNSLISAKKTVRQLSLELK